MRNTLLLSAALLAILAGPAMAQRGERGGEHGGGERGGGRPPAAAPAPAPQAAPANRAEAGRQSMQRDQAQRAQAGSRDRNNFAQSNNNGRNDNNRPGANRGNDNRGGNFGRNDNNNRPDFNRGNNRPGARNNWTQYHRTFNAPQRYRWRGPAYHRPSGWYARRWSFGDFLPSLFWGSNYWINDFGYYGLMSPPPGTVWIRDGDDAILIDRYTGEVIQVEYSVFY